VSNESTLDGRDLFLSAAQVTQDREGIGAEALVEAAEALLQETRRDMAGLSRPEIANLLGQSVSLVQRYRSRGAMHFTPPQLTETEDGWRVAWRSDESGFEGHTGLVYSKPDAVDLCARLNDMFPEMRHWIQSI